MTMYEGDGGEQVLVPLTWIVRPLRIAIAAEIVGQYHEAARSKPGRGIAPIRLGAAQLVRTDDGCPPALTIEQPAELNVVLGCEMDQGTGYFGRRWCWRDRWRWRNHWGWRGGCLLWSWFGATSNEHKERGEEQE